MLVLSRKLGESLVINDNIKITVVGIVRGQVRFGVEAPKNISVHREEVHQRIQEEKAHAKVMQATA